MDDLKAYVTKWIAGYSVKTPDWSPPLIFINQEDEPVPIRDITLEWCNDNKRLKLCFHKTYGRFSYVISWGNDVEDGIVMDWADNGIESLDPKFNALWQWLNDSESKSPTIQPAVNGNGDQLWSGIVIPYGQDYGNKDVIGFATRDSVEMPNGTHQVSIMIDTPINVKEPRRFGESLQRLMDASNGEPRNVGFLATNESPYKLHYMRDKEPIWCPGCDLEEIRDDSENDPRPNKVLAISLGGQFQVLEYQGKSCEQASKTEILEYMIEDQPDIDGVIVWEGDWKPIGTSDWPDGGMEYGLVGDWRPAMQEEWNNYLNDDFVWDAWHPNDKGQDE